MTVYSDPKPFTIAICGGGITGLALAIGLHRQKVPFHIYESAPAFAEVGAGVAFSPNSIRAMELISPQIRSRYEEIQTRNWDPKKLNTWLEFRLGCDLGVQQGGHSYGSYNENLKKSIEGPTKAGAMIVEVRMESDNAIGGTVHRASFLNQLIALVPSRCISYNHRVTDIEDLGEKRVRLHFAHGGSTISSAVIGCDGVRSNVRRILLGDENPAAHPSFAGKYVYRGLIPMTEAVDLLGDDLARNGQMYLGYHGHLLTFPIEHGETMNVVAVQSKRDGKWEDERWVLPTKEEDMRNDFAEWGQNVKGILSLMQKPDVWALFDYPAAATYCKGRICLLGDAAHASTPHQGSGAGMALEDAFIMSNLLGCMEREEEIEVAFKAYDKVRRPRTQELVKTSKECGELFDFEDESVGDDLERFRENIGQRMKWIWHEDLQEHLMEAKRAMESIL